VVSNPFIDNSNISISNSIQKMWSGGAYAPPFHISYFNIFHLKNKKVRLPVMGSLQKKEFQM
jgi:hypothetical protein